MSPGRSSPPGRAACSAPYPAWRGITAWPGWLSPQASSGCLGGALVMNARAYGGQMADVVESVQALDEA